MLKINDFIDGLNLTREQNDELQQYELIDNIKYNSLDRDFLIYLLKKTKKIRVESIIRKKNHLKTKEDMLNWEELEELEKLEEEIKEVHKFYNCFIAKVVIADNEGLINKCKYQINLKDEKNKFLFDKAKLNEKIERLQKEIQEMYSASNNPLW